MQEDKNNPDISQQRQLGYTTLHITLIELAAKKEDRLVQAIENILANKVVAKNENAETSNDQVSNFYQVELPQEDIEFIRDVFLDLEAAYVNEQGEATPTAAFYASLVAKWENLLDYNT